MPFTVKVVRHWKLSRDLDTLYPVPSGRQKLTYERPRAKSPSGCGCGHFRCPYPEITPAFGADHQIHADRWRDKRLIDNFLETFQTAAGKSDYFCVATKVAKRK
jgi:hypothetical protein